MQGKIYLNLSGDNALSPLPTIGVWQGSAVTLFVGGLPRKCGKVEVTAVNVAIKNADGETQSLGATYAGGWWAVTFSAAVFAHSGIVKNGVTVSADGLDELGGAVEGWILRKGDLEVREADGTIRPGEIVDEMRWYDVAPESPRKGDVAPVEDVISLYDGEEWRPLGSSVALDDTVTETSANGVKSSGIWSFVKGLLPSWLTPSREEPPTQASVAAKYTKPSEGIPLSDMEVSVFPPEAHAHTNDSWFTTAIESVKSWASGVFAAITHSHASDSWFTSALSGKLDKSGDTMTGNLKVTNSDGYPKVLVGDSGGDYAEYQKDGIFTANGWIGFGAKNGTVAVEDDFSPSAPAAYVGAFVQKAVRYQEITPANTALSEAAINILTTAGQTYTLPTLAAGEKRVRDLLLYVNTTAAAFAINFPSGTQLLGDNPSITEAGEYIITMTAMPSGKWFVRKIKMEAAQ